VAGMDTHFIAGRDFIRREGRVLERRLLATCFENAAGDGVIDALTAYRNDDGGFGHGLEPDKRCPSSLPIDVEVALQAMVTAATTSEPMVRQACDYLAAVAARAGLGGAVPPAFADIESYPRAAHWTEWTYEPGLNPTAGLAGLLTKLKVEHPWVTQATAWCWEQLSGPELPDEVHTLSEVLVFLENAHDTDRAQETAQRVRDHLATVGMYLADPDAAGYGLSPLHFAPLATSRWRSLFGEEVIQAHLDRLERDQQPDGGWPITWDPPSEASRLEWRGMVTLSALRTLDSYGR
jgi:hypothetical protein